MKLDLANNVSCDNWKLKDVCKVLGKLNGVDSLNTPACDLCKCGKTSNLALLSLNTYDANSDALAFGIFTKIFVEFIVCTFLLLCPDFVKSS